MRITQSSMSRNYLKALNNNLTNMDQTFQRLNTGLKLNKVSDNVADAAKAFSIREQLYKKEQSLDSIRDAYNELSAAEGNLMSSNDVFQSVMETMVRMTNDTFDEDQRAIAGAEIRGLQEQLLQMANAQFGSKNLFAGTNNSERPFELLDDGTITYNGVDVDSLEAYDPAIHTTLSADLPANFDAQTGMAVYEDPPGSGEYKPVDSNANVYLDVELGLTITPTANGSTVDSTSVIKLSNTGTEMFGFGTDADGHSMNIIAFVGDVADALENNDTDLLGDLIDKSKEIHSDLTTALADIGTRTNFMEKTTDRYETDIVALKESQNDLETADLEEESINYQIYQRAWSVSLQLGSRILPTSIFDFMG